MPQWPQCLRAWLDRQAPADTVLVVGGGMLVEAIRAAHALHPLPESAAHWLCIRAMALQADMMLTYLPEAERLVSVACLCDRKQDETPARRLTVLDPWHFLHEEEPRLTAHPLPESWDVTSDSIAARLAELTKADELVLLKSALPRHKTFTVLTQSSYVDRFFPEAAGKLPRVRLVNLRDHSCQELVLVRTTRVVRSGRALGGKPSEGKEATWAYHLSVDE